MAAINKKTSPVEEYITRFPKETQVILQKIRAVIQKAAPKATECINYGIPTFTLEGNLVHFAGYKNHIGFYPAPSGIIAFKKELSLYEGAKGSVQFPLNKPMPLQLIKQIVQFRVKENLEKAAIKNTRICSKGHRYIKSSDCPACPVCEKERKPTTGFLSVLSAPACRAMESKGIKTVKQLSKFSEAEVLSWHGVGPGSIPALRKALAKAGLSFK
jgi:uncharacterized protein YdhG (YjbR/CyaY superfamily)